MGVDCRAVAEEGEPGAVPPYEGGVGPGAVGLAHAQAQAVVGKGV